jgi:hypothetical protein
VQDILCYICLATFALLTTALSRLRARAVGRGAVGALRTVSRLSPLPALALLACAASGPFLGRFFPLALLLAGSAALCARASLP